MGLLGGGFLRLFQTLLYVLAFCCSAIVIGIYSYFLAVLSDRNQTIANTWKAVEGISGIAVVYTIFAIVLTCCLGGISFFAFLAIVLNVCFVAGFIAIAVMTRDGARSCSGTVTTPLGTGPSNAGTGFGQEGFGAGSDNNQTYAVTLGNACRFNKVVFAVSIIAAFLFIMLTFTQIFLAKSHKKEKRFGPSPNNNYTSGSGKRKFWQRKPRGTAAAGAGTAAHGTHNTHGTHGHHGHRDAEMGAVDTRPSHDTGYTGSTMAAPAQTGFVKDAEPVGHSTHGRYYTQPEGTGVNPYGYNGNAGHTGHGGLANHNAHNGTNGHNAPARNF